MYATTAGKTLVWTKGCSKAFEWAKTSFSSAPILAYQNFSEGQQFIVNTDASATGEVAVL